MTRRTYCAFIVPLALFGAVVILPETHGAPDEKLVAISVRLGEDIGWNPEAARSRILHEFDGVAKLKSPFRFVSGGTALLPNTPEPADITHGFKLEGTLGSVRNERIHVDLTATYIGHMLNDDGSHQFDTVATRLFRDVPIGEKLRFKRDGRNGPGWMELTLKRVAR